MKVKLNGTNYNITTVVDCIPIENYANYNDYIKKSIEKDSEIDSIIEELLMIEDTDGEINQRLSEAYIEYYQLLRNAVVEISDIPESELILLPEDQIQLLLSQTNFYYTPVERFEFTFRSITQDEEEILRDEINELPFYKFHHRNKLKKQLHEKLNTKFFVNKQLGYDSMAQFIKSTSIIKELNKANEDVINGSLTSLNKIIANMARPKGQEYTPEYYERMCEIFKKLPVCICLDLGAFFLNKQVISSIFANHYLRMKIVTKKHQLN